MNTETDETMDIETASDDGHCWKGEKLHPFSWEHDIAFDLLYLPGSEVYNVQLMLWMLTMPPEKIESLLDTPALVRPLVKEFAIENKIGKLSPGFPLAKAICLKVREQIERSETDPVIESAGGSSGPK